MTKDRSGPVWSIGVIMNTWYTEKRAKRKKEGGRWGGESEAGRQTDRQTNGVEEKNQAFGPNIH